MSHAAPGKMGGLRRWLDERTGLGDLVAFARHKQVPLHRHSIWYYFGGMTLFLFGLQVATGILLLLYYRPSPDHAYESVQFLMTEVHFGWLVRSIHFWAANLMVGAAFVHFFSVFLLKAYRRPREVTWISGIVLLALTLGFGFTGYLLPWNELSFFATRVGTEIPGAMPLVGDFLVRLLRGGERITGGTLTRFYGIHVAILPAAMTVFLAVHLLLVQRHGMSIPPAVRREGRPLRALPFVPNYVIRETVGWLAALAGVAALAAFLPAELGEKADPFASAPAGIRPEWYFVAVFQTLKYLPARVAGVNGELIGVLAFAALGVSLLLVPFLDRRDAREGEGSAGVTGFALALLVYLVVLSLLGYVS